jgi:hypothetical protein
MANKRAVTVAWRATYTGELAIPVAFRRVAQHVEYVRPAEKTAGATHGVFTYVDADVILLLEQTSITRRRYVTIYLCNTDRDLCRRLAELAEIMWQATGNPKLVVAKILETYGPAT